MYAYNPQDPHPVTQFNCTAPCRPHQIGQADRDASYGLHRNGCDNSKEGDESVRYVLLAPVIGDNSAESKPPAASPAAGGASERCICLEYIGDNGPCPVHGTRGGAK